MKTSVLSGIVFVAVRVPFAYANVIRRRSGQLFATAFAHSSQVNLL